MSVERQDLTKEVKAGIRTLWWLFLLRGVFALVFGILALANRDAAVQLLSWVLGVYIILDGIVTLIAAIAERKKIGSIGWFIFQGLLGIIVGVAILIFSNAFATIVGLVIIWAVIIIALLAGIIGLRLSIAARGVTKTWGWGIFANVLTLIFGVVLAILVFTNTEGLLAVLLILVGIWALIVGIALIIWSFIARRFINEAFKSLSVTQTTVQG